MLTPPAVDPTPIFELFRGSYATELLTAAVCHFGLFGRLAHACRRTRQELAGDLGLADRPTIVLTTALSALGLLKADASGRLDLTELAREHLLPGGPFDVGDYVGLAAQSPGVLAMVERLRTNRPASGRRAAPRFIFREGVASAMDERRSRPAPDARARRPGPQRRPGTWPASRTCRCAAARRRRRRHRHLRIALLQRFPRSKRSSWTGPR